MNEMSCAVKEDFTGFLTACNPLEAACSGEISVSSATQRSYQKTFDFAMPDEHFSLVHASQRGSVLVWEKRTDGNVWHKIQPDQTAPQISQLLNGLAGKLDTYFSINEFHGWRVTRLLKSLRANYVDIDLGRPADKFDLDAALNTLADQQLPWPSLCVFSGRGMHLYWCTTHTPSTALPVWQAVQKRLIDSLSNLGADHLARDCARVLRLVGTRNSKNNEEVRGLVLDAKPWTFHDLCDNVLGYRERAPVRSLDAKRKIITGHHPKATSYRRWHLVFRDLLTIGAHYKTIPAGHRNEFLFISSVALSWFADPRAIQDEVVDLAKQFCPDINEPEAICAASQSVKRAAAAAAGEKYEWLDQEVDPRIRMRRETLFDRLGDLAKPVRSKMRAIIDDEQAETNKKERDSARWSDHNTGQGVRQGNVEKRDQARAMKADGASIQAIATALCVKSKSTIHRWLA